MKRYTEREFPTYAHRPGKTIHPNKEGGHSYQWDEPDTETLTNENYENHSDYLYAIDLFNHQYFWESHVYWEAIWHKAGRKGETADFLKALILLAAGCLKLELAQEKAAKGHFSRAEELFSSFTSKEKYGVYIVNIASRAESEGVKFKILLEK